MVKMNCFHEMLIYDNLMSGIQSKYNRFSSLPYQLSEWVQSFRSEWNLTVETKQWHVWMTQRTFTSHIPFFGPQCSAGSWYENGSWWIIKNYQEIFSDINCKYVSIFFIFFCCNWKCMGDLKISIFEINIITTLSSSPSFLQTLPDKPPHFAPNF